MAKKEITTIDDYIKPFTKEIKTILQGVRDTIKKELPDATETISYGIPTFDMNGKHLIHFAGFKNHVGIYPTPSALEHFAKELSEYETSTGTVKFPISKPIPFDLIKRIAQYRLTQH